MSITCLECPSFLRRDEASEFFGISAGGPMCARYGWILGNGDNAMEGAVTKYSENCLSRGNERPTSEIASPSTFGATYTPRPELLVENGESVRTCESCVNFDEAAHACAAIGKTLFPERLETEATGCLWAKRDDDFVTSIPHERVGMHPAPLDWYGRESHHQARRQAGAEDGGRSQVAEPVRKRRPSR